MSETSQRYIVRDRDIIRDTAGRMLVVLGYIQPKNRVLSFLKYIPASEGRWEFSGQKYRRIFYGNVEAVIDGLEIVPAGYLVEDTYFGTILLEIPFENITEHYKPDSRLEEILTHGPEDKLEDAVAGMATALHDQLGIPLKDIGVAGSIAWKGHNPEFSDINMNVYGFENSWNLQRNHEKASMDTHVRLRNLEEWDTGISRVVNRIPSLSVEDMKRLFARRFAFYYDEQCIGVTPVLWPEEAPISHGDETYTQASPEPLRINFEVENADYGLFHPSLLVGKALTDTPENKLVSRVMIYDGAFTGLFSTGDILEVSGTLQRVVSAAKEVPEFYQLMVGTKDGARREYIRFIEQAELS